MRSTEAGDYLPSTHVHTYNSELSYRCGLGRRFLEDDGVTETEFLNYTCPESGAWSPGPVHLQPCVWVACIDAPLPPNGSFLTNLQYLGRDYERDLTEVDLAGKVIYHCFNGMRSRSNLAFSTQEATCTEGTQWVEPATWENCTDTNYCPVPPNGVAGSVVFANSTGNRFGAVCRGSDISAGLVDGVEPLAECPNVEVKYANNRNVTGSVHYSLFVTTDSTRADSTFFQIQFDAPVTGVDFNGYNYPDLVDPASAFNDTDAEYHATLAPQVVGIYKYLKLDPLQTRAIDFVVNFDPQYATACIEKIVCSREAKGPGESWITYELRTTFREDQLAALQAETFFEQNVTWPYETSLEYHCPKAQAYEDAGGVRHDSQVKAIF